jgi:enoyl-CoA hydratase/carnithine racemase
MNERVKYEIRDDIAYITLNRADKYNALDPEMFDALIKTANKIKNNKSLRAVILSGAGKAFCTGLDFPSFITQKKTVLFAFLKRPFRKTNQFQKIAWMWREIPIPVISVIHGYCFGGGVQIALASDFRFITPDCEFSILEAKWGMIPDMSASVTLRELVSIDQAKLLSMTGRIISGTKAHQLNLVTGVSIDPMAMAEALVEELKQRSPDSVVATKKLFHQTWSSSEAHAFARERMIQLGLLLGKNQNIAMKANLKKEKPNFLNRK